MRRTDKTLLEQMQISDAEIQRRKELLGLDESVLQRLCEQKALIEEHLETIVEEFYEKQTETDEISLLIGDADTLLRLRSAQRQYIIDLFSGQYDSGYVNNRLRIGMVHKRIGVEPKLYLSAVRTLKALIARVLREKLKDSVQRAQTLEALDKLLYFDTTLVFDTYISSLVGEIETAKKRTEEYAKSLEDKVAERTRQLAEQAKSESYQQRLELQKSEQRFRLLVSSVRDYAILMLDLNGYITSWNAGAQRSHGYAEGEILGQHFSRFYLPEDIEAGKPDTALRTALTVGRFEDYAWRVRKNGDPYWAHVVIDLVRDESGTPIGFAKITRDMSERREAEARMLNLTKVNQELQQFVQVASHDLREPLRKILTFSDLLDQEAGQRLNDEEKQYLCTIASSTERMQALLENLLRLTKVSSHGGLFEECDLRAVCTDVCSDLELLIEEKQARIDIGELPAIFADRTQMHQLLQNLIGNSLKYARPDVPPLVQVKALPAPDTDHIALEVSDNGIGFEAQYRERIFGIFERLHTRDEFEGSGVGLAICRKICERHGGRIEAHGVPNDGTRIRFMLANDPRSCSADTEAAR